MFLGLVLACGLGACASVSVTNEVALTEPAPSHLPGRIFVRPFEFDEGNVKVDREGEKLAEFQRGMQDEMSKNLVERFRKYIAPAEALPASATPPPGSHWLVTGSFTRVNQGSRFLRSAFGFGSGGTKLDMEVTLSELSEAGARPLLLIRTSGGSNAMPGAIMGVINWTMILSGGEGIIAGLSGDGRRTSREITAAICDYLRAHGVQVAKGAPTAKRKGAPSWWPKKKTGGEVN